MNATSGTPADGTLESPAQARARLLRERRQRRRAAARRWAIRSALGSVALLLLLALLGYWLLRTLTGRDFLLAQIVARLPADATLSWQRAEGPVTGPLTLHGVHFAWHGTVFDARRVRLDPDVRPLLGKLLRLDALDIEGATLALPRDDKPFALPRWPKSLPQIALPMSLQADRIRIDGLRVIREGERLIDVRTLRGGLDARPGKLHVEHLVIASDRGHFRLHGDYAPRDNYRTALSMSALLPAPAGRTRPRLGLAARGDLAQMQVALRGDAPAPLHALLTLHGGQDNPRWQLHADSSALDPGLLGGGAPGTPLAFEFDAGGAGGAADVHGRLTRGDLVAVLQPSKLRVEQQVLVLDPLVLDVSGGRISARGRGDFGTPGDASFKLAVSARALAFGGAADNKPLAGKPAATPVIAADADLDIAGRTRAWTATGKATLTRERQHATLTFTGAGNADGMRVQALRAAMPTGTLDGSASVAWAPAWQWTLDARLAGFDPGYFAPDWKGAIDGTLASSGRSRDDGGLDVRVAADKLGGSLRARKLGGHANLLLHTPGRGQARSDYAGDIALSLGGSRIEAKGKAAQALDIVAKFSPLQLDDLLPGAAGTLRGTLALRGARDAPDLGLDLVGSGLRYGDYHAASASAKGRLPWRGGNGALAINAQDARLGVALDRLRIDATGAVEHLRLDAHARGQIGALDVAGSADKRGANWQGTLASLQLAPLKGTAWRLQAPARFAQAGRRWTLSSSCFASDSGGALCASADWPQHGLRVAGTGLPLALAAPYLPERDDGRPWLLRGEIAVDAALRPDGDAWQGHLRASSPSGGLRFAQRARNEVIAYDNLALDARFNARRIHATLGSAVDGDGRLDARIDTGWASYAPLAGEVALATDELTWMELFSPDIVAPTGKLAGRIALTGTRAQPSLGGQARLSAFGTELPSLGLVLQDGDVRLDALPDGSARIDGSVRSGAGTLRIDGTLGWHGDDTPLVLHLHGKQVLLSDTRNLRAVADPEITVRYAARQPLDVSGVVTVTSAMIDLERLDDGVSASPDVVVLDPVDPRRSGAAPRALDLTLAMGDDVRLKGFGLDGTLGGSLRVRARPGREMSGSGTLEIGGKYSAYGQKLQITRGRLVFNNGPVSDPILDIRAERRIEAQDITAGISVSGRASAPRAEVWTDPSSDNAEALSYLALGRSTANLSGDESRQLDAAAAALSAGGGLLASQIGAKIGLDDAGVMESRALGGSVLGIGKQLSPRLYVGFGVSLLGTGQVLTLKYLLRKGFDIEIESSTLENRGSVNWRKEK